MDAGLAAVLGALAGSVATIGAALATGWAQREGARITARSEHRRERREPRHTAYREMIEAATSLRDMTVQYELFDASEISSDVHLREQDILGLHAKQALVRKRAIEVALVGPAPVGEVAMRVASVSNHLFLFVTALSGFLNAPEPIDDHTWSYSLRKAESLSKEYGQEVDQLISLAQAALDDDGSAT
ncbi:hypothetical protein ACFV7O_21665 [Streptomyces tendae]|uniref:hypothetical protein n=1 Tax=Streptomyces tendae TaxID=1932 RepID=UPI0036675500